MLQIYHIDMSIHKLSIDGIMCLWLSLCKETFLDAIALIDESPQILTRQSHMNHPFCPKSLACVLNILIIIKSFLIENGQAFQTLLVTKKVHDRR